LIETILLLLAYCITHSTQTFLRQNYLVLTKSNHVFHPQLHFNPLEPNTVQSHRRRRRPPPSRTLPLSNAFPATNNPPPSKSFDGRELALLTFIHTHSSLSTLRNNPSSILAAIDEFGRTKDFLMTVGPATRDILALLIAKQRPKIVLDVGAYVGNSALMVGGALVDLYALGGRGLGECKVFSFEKDPMCAAITSSFIDLAGLKRGG